MNIFGHNHTNLLKFRNKKQIVTAPINNSFDLEDHIDEEINERNNQNNRILSMNSKNKEKNMKSQNMNNLSKQSKLRSMQMSYDSIQFNLPQRNNQSYQHSYDSERNIQQIKIKKNQLAKKLHYIIEHFNSYNNKNSSSAVISSQLFYNIFQLRKNILRGPINQLKYLYQIQYTNFLSFLLYILETKQERFKIYDEIEDYQKIRQIIENEINQVEEIMLVSFQIKSEILFGKQFEQQIQYIQINTQAFMQRYKSLQKQQKNSSISQQNNQSSLDKQMFSQQIPDLLQKSIQVGFSQKIMILSDQRRIQEQEMQIKPQITYNLISNKSNTPVQTIQLKKSRVQQQKEIQIVDVNNSNAISNIMTIQVEEPMIMEIKCDQSPIDIDN